MISITRNKYTYPSWSSDMETGSKLKRNLLKVKEEKMYKIVLSIIHVHVMSKTNKKKNLQSQTKIVGILPLNTVFFPPFLSSLPPNVVYCSSLTKSCPLTLEGPEDSKVSQQFWLENNRKNFHQI